MVHRQWLFSTHDWKEGTTSRLPKTEGWWNGEFTIKRVAYVEGLKHNLISVSHLMMKD